MPMTNNSIRIKTEVSKTTVKSPRLSSIHFIRQFARACSTVKESNLGIVILN